MKERDRKEHERECERKIVCERASENERERMRKRECERLCEKEIVLV